MAQNRLSAATRRLRRGGKCATRYGVRGRHKQRQAEPGQKLLPQVGPQPPTRNRGTARTAPAARQHGGGLRRRLHLRGRRTEQRQPLAGCLPTAFPRRQAVGAPARPARCRTCAARGRGAEQRHGALLLPGGRIYPCHRHPTGYGTHRRVVLQPRHTPVDTHGPHCATRPHRGRHPGRCRRCALGLCPHSVCGRCEQTTL